MAFSLTYTTCHIFTIYRQVRAGLGFPLGSDRLPHPFERIQVTARMATTNTKFQLLCRTPDRQNPLCRLTFTHPLPNAVCVEPTQEIEAQLKALLISILDSHNPAVLGVSPKQCFNCPSPASTVNYNPLSFLHTSNPRINCPTTVVCSSVDCQTRIHYDAQHILAVVTSGEDPINAAGRPKSRCCKCFAMKSDLQLCGGCRKVVYCGEACQWQDWRRHRRACTVAPGG